MTNLGDLEVFTRVVSTGSMSAAGRALGFSPAVISKRIKRLEDRLGTRLLQRTTRQISLTEAGQGFYDRVLGILAGVEEAEAFASGRSAQPHGTLRVTAPTSFGRMHIAPHLARFMEAHPELVVNIVLSDEFTDIVAEGFDLAIRIGELDDSSLVARKLAPVRRILCASPAYIERHGIPETVDDLGRHVCLPPAQPRHLEARKPAGFAELQAAGPADHQFLGGRARGGALRRRHRAALDLGYRRRLEVGTAACRSCPPGKARSNLFVSALYPSRQFLPAKVRLFIDYLAELYGPQPYWER